MDANLNQPATLQDMHESVSAWFLGPRAENFPLLKELFNGVLNDHARVRENYHPEDGIFISQSVQQSSTFKINVDVLRKEIQAVSELLNDYSVPFFSPRYAGHMCWETSLPAITGWLMAGLFNQNNVAFEASPVTTLLELEVGQQMCSMLGYSTDAKSNVKCWGHIACDGTVANMESMWVARNLKFFPLSLHAAVTEGQLNFVADAFKIVTTGDPDKPQLFKDLDSWQLLNLATPVILGLGDQLYLEFGITPEYLATAMSPYLVQTCGKAALLSKYDIALEPQYFVSSTKHYSWPKSAALLGIGSENCVRIPVDSNARIDVDCLQALLQDRLDKKQAVYGVVAIIGSTEEGAVDPLDKVIELRDKFAEQGMTFVVHADAAWGGYFASMIRDPPRDVCDRWDDQVDEEGSRDFVPSVTMRQSVVDQFHALARADSISIDPHKAGYIPYPAGGLCYRDGRMRYLVTWTAPYLHDSDNGESIGVYGIEGSKPGAAAVACYLHNTVVGLHKQGHGGLLGEVAFTCRRLSAHWAAMSNDETDFVVVPFNKFRREQEGKEAVAEEKKFIRDNILGKTNQALAQNTDAMDELCALGSDLNINAFACNFRINGRVNDDVEEANYLNNRIFDRLSLTSVGEQPQDIPMFLSATQFGHADYAECAEEYKRRLGLETRSQQDLFVLRNVVMSPFQGAGDFVQNIADIFQSTLEEEMQHVIKRNTVSPQIHEFTMQGTDELYLVYRPLFHHANGRQQLILSVGDVDADAWAKCKTAMSTNPGAIYEVQTSTATTLDKLLDGCRSCGDLSFRGDMTGPDLDLKSVDFNKVKVIKQRTLLSAWRDVEYPATSTPFYLYGSHDEQHVEHMLLRAPNAQISSACVKLDVSPALSAEQLARGVLACVQVPECALQPLGAQHPFTPNARFRVTIAEDSHQATAKGPGLAIGGSELARGTLTFGDAVFTDVNRLNTQDFVGDGRADNSGGNKRADTSMPLKANQSVKDDWAKAVSDRLGLKAGGGKVVAAPTGSVGAELVPTIVEAGGEVVKGAVNAGGSVTQGILKGGGDVAGGALKAGGTLFGGFRL